MGDLSEHFDRIEFERCAPVPDSYLPNLRALVSDVLEPIRRAFGPVRVTSGYRTIACNDAVKGSATSQHLAASAADFKVRSGRSTDSLEVVRWLVEQRSIPWDQAIWYDDSRGGHVHVSISDRPRRQALHAPESGGYAHWDPLAGEGRQAEIARIVREHPIGIILTVFLFGGAVWLASRS